MDVRIRVALLRENIHLVVVMGDLDLFSAPTLWHAIEKLVADGVRTIVIDFAAVTFVDSTAVGVLVNATRLLRHSDGNLYLTDGCGVLQRAAETAQLDDFLQFRDSLAGVTGAAA